MLVEVSHSVTGFSDIRFRHNFDELLQLEPNADIDYIGELKVEIRRFLNRRTPEHVDSDRPTSRHDSILSQTTNSFSNTIIVTDPIMMETDSPSEDLEKLLLLYTGKTTPV